MYICGGASELGGGGEKCKDLRIFSWYLSLCSMEEKSLLGGGGGGSEIGKTRELQFGNKDKTAMKPGEWY